MIKINKKIINADTIHILENIKSYILNKDGKVILKDIRDIGENVMVTCPFHKDGNERKPSCGVSNIDKDDYPAGTVHCFTCGKTMFIDKFISHLLNYDDSGEEGRKWLIENFDVGYSRTIKINLTRYHDRTEALKEEISNINELMLQEYRYTHPYMYKRGLTDEIIEKYDIGFDKYNNCVTFPVKDMNGNCIFLAKRGITSKMFILPSGGNKPLYGVYELDYNKSDVYICESFFNALTLVKWGFNAIALMGTGSNHQYELINKLPFRTIHLCLDGDLAGKVGSKKLLTNINNTKMVYNHIMTDGMDVNDLTLEQFENLRIERRI